MSFDYSGKTVFVAGGTSGINLGVAKAFAAAGARVAVLSRRQEKVDAAVALLKELGPDAAGYAADVRDYAAVEQALQQGHARFGAFDVLVSGAAGNFPAKALGMSANAFKTVVDIDLLGTYHVLRAGHPLMRKPGGSIINISAPQAFLAMNMQMHVCAAKAGVDMVTRVGAVEWGVEGIRVNSVCPGPIEDTEGMERLAPTEAARQAVMNSVPMKRYGQASEIADCCLWLGSPMAAYVTGTVIPVDGGWALGGATSIGQGFEQLNPAKG